jgi:SAM-dependent methyltransferase
MSASLLTTTLRHISELLRSPGLKLQNIRRGVRQRRGSTAEKADLWDREYASGKWDHCQDTVDPVLYAAIARYSRAGRLLDLGCGWGSTAVELPPSAVSYYLGVDISAVAIASATRRSEGAALRRNAFVVGDIAHFDPGGHFEVILFRESLYYLPDVGAALRYYSQFLVPLHGCFIVTLASRARYGDVLDVIAADFEVLEELPGDGPGVAIAFAPRRTRTPG